MDFIDKFRYWLIQKLSCGDMILMNFEIRSDGSLINRNLGPSIIVNADITAVDVNYGLRIGRNYKRDACLGVAADKNLIISECSFREL